MIVVPVLITNCYVSLKGASKYLERMARVAILDPDEARRREDTGTKSPTEEQRSMDQEETCARRVNTKCWCRRSEVLRGTL